MSALLSPTEFTYNHQIIRLYLEYVLPDGDGGVDVKVGRDRGRLWRIRSPDYRIQLRTLLRHLCFVDNKTFDQNQQGQEEGGSHY